MAVPPKFAVLWKAYSTNRVGGGCASWKHQCAIRMSACLATTGFKITKSYRYMKNTCKANGVVHARAAEELANYLTWKLPVKKQKYPHYCAHYYVKGKQGIILFKDIAGFAASRGDHIDLWNKTKTKTKKGAYFNRCTSIEFWELK